MFFPGLVGSLFREASPSFTPTRCFCLHNMMTCEPRHRPSSETGYNRDLCNSLSCKTGCQKYRRNSRSACFGGGPSHLDLARPRLAGPPISPRRRTDASAARSGRTSLLHHAPLPIPLITLTLTLSLSLLTSSSGAHTLVSTVFSFGARPPSPPSPPGPALKTRVDRENQKIESIGGKPAEFISWKYPGKFLRPNPGARCALVWCQS